jgi:transcriptional regulator with XRE-family HTH domain
VPRRSPDVRPAGPLAALGAAIREARLADGVTQAELAERCEVNVNYVSLLERGQRNPTATMLFTLAAALAIPPEDLFRNIGPLDLRTLVKNRSRRGAKRIGRHR